MKRRLYNVYTQQRECFCFDHAVRWAVRILGASLYKTHRANGTASTILVITFLFLTHEIYAHSILAYWAVYIRFLDPTWSASAWEMLGPFNLYLGPAQKEPSGVSNELMYNFRVHITSLLLSQPENCLVNIFIVSSPSRRLQPFMSRLRSFYIFI